MLFTFSICRIVSRLNSSYFIGCFFKNKIVGNRKRFVFRAIRFGGVVGFGVVEISRIDCFVLAS
jgi:hypothetical protein